MVSTIDPTKPVTGIDQPVQVIRDNFARAKIEIEELQAEKLNIFGGTLTGVLRFASFTETNLPDSTINPGGVVFVSDASPPSLFFSDGANWEEIGGTLSLDDLTDVNVGTPGAAEDGFVLTWDDSAGEFQLKAVAGTGTVTSVDVDSPGGTLTVDGGPITTAGTLTVDITNSGVTPDTYINPTITVDAQGRITTASNNVVVSSVFGRINDVVAESGDYDAEQITITPFSDITSTDVQSALEELKIDVDNKSPVTRIINAQTGTLYVLALSDAGNVVAMDNALSNTVVIPTNASVAFSIGTQVDILMIGTGTTSVGGDTGVILNGVSAGSGDIQNQYSAVTILKVNVDEWIMFGDHGGVT